jgi:hypothetical protein
MLLSVSSVEGRDRGFNDPKHQPERECCIWLKNLK